MRSYRTPAQGRHQACRQRGSMAVETILILPAMLVMLMAVIETGSLFMSYQTVQKAAQMAARFAATGQGEQEGNRLTRIKTKASDLTASLHNGAKGVTVRSWPSTTPSGSGRVDDPGRPCELVEVEVDFDYQCITPLGTLMNLAETLFKAQSSANAGENEGAASTTSFPALFHLVGKDQKINEPWNPCEQK